MDNKELTFEEKKIDVEELIKDMRTLTDNQKEGIRYIIVGMQMTNELAETKIAEGA